MVLFDDETYKELLRITDKAETSVSEYVRAIIEHKLKQIKEKGE
jgi:predicted CopG family antitoxin